MNVRNVLMASVLALTGLLVSETYAADAPTSVREASSQVSNGPTGGGSNTEAASPAIHFLRWLASQLSF